MRNMEWPVLIQEVDNGYIVEVKCVKLVFTNKNELLNELMAYMDGKKTILSEKLKAEKMPNFCNPREATEMGFQPTLRHIDL